MINRFTLLLLALFPGICLTQIQVQAQVSTPPPDCIFFVTAQVTGGSPATISYPVNTVTGVTGFDNRTLGCQTWTFSYVATATSGSLSGLAFQAATGAVSPGAYGNWGGVVSTGVNPNTSSVQGTTTFATGCVASMACTVANAWVKVLFTRGSFVGTVQGVLYGYRSGYPGRGSGGGGGSGTVTEIDTGCGLSGGPITTSGTVALSQPVNSQVGTSYAIQSSDCGKLLTLSNSGSVAVSIAQAGTGGFVSGWSAHIENLGAGTVTITPATSTIDGASTLTLATNQGIVLFSNGTNYFTERGRASAPTQLHSITFAISGGGSVISTGDTHEYVTVDFACTINRVDISGNPSGSITVDIWKANAAIPTSMNLISAMAPATLSGSQLSQSGSLMGWTTSVNVNDVFDANVASATTTTSATVQIWCQ